jgi:uncharacterized lipoprotein YddW (UPF0748 family)
VYRLGFLFALMLLGAPVAHGARTSPEKFPPLPEREFRGAWVASVSNIDWPSKKGLSTDQQKRELIAILEKCRQLKLNVVILQVRPSCDALYASKIEPWSEYLTGVQGKAPAPYWDPLEYAVNEAHARGIELHAWFNPFRARHSGGGSRASTHISKTRPAWAKNYGSQIWLDPGLPEVHDYSARVILDVVQRYDIDGVHIDDYFYPYPEKDKAKKDMPFPDWTSWNNYQKTGGSLSRDGWRRDNVNRFVRRLYGDIHKAKPWVKVGISPFGIFRPGYPSQIKGFDQYESLYADPRTWLANGWLDYLAPQLYWRIEPAAQSFPVLLKWWAENNPHGRFLVPGINTSAVGKNRSAWPADEIIEQIDLTRKQPGTDGHVHWSMSALMNNEADVADDLGRKTYKRAALVPALPGHLTKLAPAPSFIMTNNPNRRPLARWNAVGADPVRHWVMQYQRDGTWRTEIRGGGSTSREFSAMPDIVVLTGVNRFGNFSESKVWRRYSP